jgi:2-keto-myo-inositol isomerase
MATSMNRRGFMAAAGAGAAMAAQADLQNIEVGGGLRIRRERFQENLSPWPLCINTSTIRPASLDDKIRITAETGWDAIEPWLSDLEAYEKEGGNLKDLGNKIKDLGMYVPNVIGLWNCMPEGEKAFEASLEKTRNGMRIASAIGSKLIATVPTPDRADFDPRWAVQCYRRLLNIGLNDYGINPAFEFLGFLKGIHTLGVAAGVAIDTDHPQACIINDTYHMFRGGSGFNGLSKLSGKLMAQFHINDVPGDVPREEMGDEHRLFPGDGVLPLAKVFQDLKKIGYQGAISLETFNRKHWEMDPKVVAQEGIDKVRASIADAGV